MTLTIHQILMHCDADSTPGTHAPMHSGADRRSRWRSFAAWSRPSHCASCRRLRSRSPGPQPLLCRFLMRYVSSLLCDHNFHVNKNPACTCMKKKKREKCLCEERKAFREFRMGVGGGGRLKHDCYIYCSFYRCSHVWVNLVDLKIKQNLCM